MDDGRAGQPSKFRRTRHRKQEADVKYVCAICGDEAASYNFGALCCESCKAFFRRNLTASRNYTCGNGGNCTITKQTRKFCSSCRMRKCRDAGMSSDPLTVAYIQDVNSGVCERRKLKRKNGQGDKGDMELDAKLVASVRSESSYDQISDTDYQSPYSARSLGDSDSYPTTSRRDEHEFIKMRLAQCSSARLDSKLSRPSGSDGRSISIGLERSDGGGAFNVVRLTAQPFASFAAKQQHNMRNSVLEGTGAINFSQQEFFDSVTTCQRFADIMLSPFSEEEIGPAIEDMLPDDPVVLTRFPEAALRKYVSALKNVPEFQDHLTSEERFFMLKTSLIHQQGVVCAFFGDPDTRCFSGKISTGATFCHYADYTIEQFDKAGVHSRPTIDSMMKFYRELRDFSCRHNASWSTLAAYLSITKFFTPHHFIESSPANSLANQSDNSILGQLLPKLTSVYLKYKTLFKQYVQSLVDQVNGSLSTSSGRIDASIDMECESLFSAAGDTCNTVSEFFIDLIGALRLYEQSDVLVPLMNELLA